MYRVESHKSKSSKNNSVPLIAIIRYTTLFAQKSKKKKNSKNFPKRNKKWGASSPAFTYTFSHRNTNFRVLPRSRVSYARQIAVMTVHHGKKCHVRGKQNVSRAYVPPFPSPPPSLFSSRPRRFLHTARRCLWSVAFSAIPCLSLSYTYMRGSRVVFAGGRGRERPGRTSRGPMSRRNDYIPGSGSSIDEKYHHFRGMMEAMIHVF